MMMSSNLVQVHLSQISAPTSSGHSSTNPAAATTSPGNSFSTMEPPESQPAQENGRFQPPQQPPASRRRPPSNFVGRHRLQASISLLELQIRAIEDELQELETFDRPSTICDGLIAGVESSPDPLLSLTRGPVDESWERWFGGANGSRRHRRWI